MPPPQIACFLGMSWNTLLYPPYNPEVPKYFHNFLLLNVFYLSVLGKIGMKQHNRNLAFNGSKNCLRSFVQTESQSLPLQVTLINPYVGRLCKGKRLNTLNERTVPWEPLGQFWRTLTRHPEKINRALDLEGLEKELYMCTALRMTLEALIYWQHRTQVSGPGLVI